MATTCRMVMFPDGTEYFKNTACFAQFTDHELWREGKKAIRIGYQYEGSHSNYETKVKYTPELYAWLVRCKRVIPSLTFLNLEYRVNGNKACKDNEAQEAEDTPLAWCSTEYKSDRVVMNLFTMRQLIRYIAQIKDMCERLKIDPFKKEDKTALQAVLFLHIAYQAKFDKLSRKFNFSTGDTQPYGKIACPTITSLYSVRKFARGGYKYFQGSIVSREGKYSDYSLQHNKELQDKYVLPRFRAGHKEVNNDYGSKTKGLCTIFAQGEKYTNFNYDSKFHLNGGSFNAEQMRDIVLKVIDVLELKSVRHVK